MIQTTITSIGEHAIGDEPLLLVFDDSATHVLKEYSLIQAVPEATFDVKKGSTIAFGNEIFTVTHVGKTANENLNSIGHATMAFEAVPLEDSIANGIYLTPHHLPKVTEGMIIQYA
jgi:PTS system glucitol/sorbitol-specific IIA component